MNRVPKVVTVQDLSGLGRCSLTVALPVLSVMGAQCCPLTTAVLSAHTAFPAPEASAFQDLSEAMEQTILHWQALQMSFDAIYSGFLGSARQIGILRNLIDTFRGPDTLLLVDPVMGDHGRVYRTYTPEMCRALGQLAAHADIITPNLTEAAILLGERYQAVPTARAGVEKWLRRLSLEGRRSVVITGISFAAGVVGAGCFDRRSGEIHFAMSHREERDFSGTGDLFASVLLGAILRGEQLADATALAVDFVQHCISHTLRVGTPMIEGVQFEAILRDLL